MILHRYKPLNFGFVIISPDHELGCLLCTIRSIRNNYPGVQHICVTGIDTPAEDFKEMNEHCLTYRGRNTITSLINTGIRKGCKDWNMIVMEGTPVRKGLDRKYSLFVENEKDVLFPVFMEYDRQGNPTRIRDSFDEASLNGMLIHQRTFKAAGDFVDSPIMLSKFFWALGAHDLGCRFKGVLGTKLV